MAPVVDGVAEAAGMAAAVECKVVAGMAAADGKVVVGTAVQTGMAVTGTVEAAGIADGAATSGYGSEYRARTGGLPTIRITATAIPPMGIRTTARRLLTSTPVRRFIFSVTRDR